MAYNVNTDLITGDKLFLFVDNTPVAFAKSCSLDINADTIDTANKFSGKWKSVLSGHISWTVSCDALYTQVSGDTSFETLRAKMVVGDAVDVIVGTATDTTYTVAQGLYSGKAFITSVSLKADTGSIAECSISMTGSGALSKVS